MKTKYLIKRICKMNYKNFFNIVNTVSKKTKKSKLKIFLDIINCGIKYEAGYIDYNLFEMYNMTEKERSTIVTRGINNEILKKYNSIEKKHIFEDKSIFNKKYNKYLDREWILLNDNLEEFKNFVNNKEYVIVKPLSLCCGKGIEKIKIKDWDIVELYNYLIKNEIPLVEEVSIQDDAIASIYPNSINTVRIVTLNKKVVASFIRFGNKDNIVDNFNHDGIVTTINTDTGIIEYPAIDKNGKIYTKHPQTNKKIVGLKIPRWNEIKKMCINACDITPEIGYVGWDVCVGKEKPSLIEGNDFPGHDLYQLPVHRKDNIGLLPKFKKIMEENNENSNSN